MESIIEQTLSGRLLNATTAQRGIVLLHHWFPIFSVVYYGCFSYLLRLENGSSPLVGPAESEEEESEEAKKEDGHRRATAAYSKALAQARLSAWVCGLAGLVLLAFVSSIILVPFTSLSGRLTNPRWLNPVSWSRTSLGVMIGHYQHITTW